LQGLAGIFAQSFAVAELLAGGLQQPAGWLEGIEAL
jgi:hypothetical protein